MQQGVGSPCVSPCICWLGVGAIIHWCLSQSALAAITSYHEIGGLNNKYDFSQVRRWKVQDQDASMIGFW